MDKLVSFKSASELRDGVVARSPNGDLLVLAGKRIAIKPLGGAWRPMVREDAPPGSLEAWDEIDDLALRWRLFKEAENAKALCFPLNLDAYDRCLEMHQKMLAIFEAQALQREQERAYRVYPKFHIDITMMDPDSNLTAAYRFLRALLIFFVLPFVVGKLLDCLLF